MYIFNVQDPFYFQEKYYKKNSNISCFHAEIEL